jgi:hypothetical protein
MKYIKLFENFLFELKKYQSGKISIITDISQLPKVGVPANKREFKRDGIVAIDWDKIVCVRSSNELPSISGKNLVCHTGRALKTVGFNKSFEDYLKKKYNEKDEPDNQYLRDDPNYKDLENVNPDDIQDPLNEDDMDEDDEALDEEQNRHVHLSLKPEKSPLLL